MQVRFYIPLRDLEGYRGLILVLGMRLLISLIRFRLFLSPKPASERNGTPSRSVLRLLDVI